MKKQSSLIILPLLLIIGVVGLSSCTKDKSVRATIKLVKNSTVLIGTDPNGDPIYDESTESVSGAQVRVWSSESPGFEEQTAVTGLDGVADFEFPDPVILDLEVIVVDEVYILPLIRMANPGDVLEETYNLDDF